MNKVDLGIKRFVVNCIKSYVCDKEHGNALNFIQDTFNERTDMFTPKEIVKYGNWILEKQFERIEKGLDR